MMKVLLVISIIFIANSLPANELRMTRHLALKAGFQPHSATHELSDFQELEAHSLSWPVQFIDSKHTIGNSMPEYQNYGTEAYYHEGADLRISRNGAVIAPVDGFLQGDYYTYVTDPETGEDKKFTKPITDGGDDLYFEITIKTSDNYILEFHHVNPKKLPKVIYDQVLKGGGPVSKGTVVGYASVWPISRLNDRYDHIHYDLISPKGIYLNPEYYSAELSDRTPPLIKNIFAIYSNKKIEVTNQKLVSVPAEIVISATDLKGENIYPLPPVKVEAYWHNDLQKAGWDFTKNLLTTAGLFPDIREVYARNLQLTDGRIFSTRGDYSSTDFLYRIKLPVSATLPITIRVVDSSDNLKSIKIEQSN